MNMRSTMKKNSIPVVVIGALLLLPSCGLIDWIKEKFGSKRPGC